MRFLDPTQPPQKPDFSKPAIIYCRVGGGIRSTDSESREYQKASGYELAKLYLAKNVVIYTDIEGRN